MKEQNKGITLVALVITIIVLIILAGVSINAVMSDGLIANSKAAKNEWNEAKAEEQEEFANLEVISIEMEAKNDFATRTTRGFSDDVEGVPEHTPYLLNEGYLTGVQLASSDEENKGCTETVASFKNKLPIGYEIYNREGNVITDENILVGTGMIIKNIEKGMRVARVVVYGDTNWKEDYFDTATLNALDLKIITRLYTPSYKDEMNELDLIEARKIAADIDHDGDVDISDNEYYKRYNSNWAGYEAIEQNVEATIPEIIYIEETEEATNEVTENTSTENSVTTE